MNTASTFDILYEDEQFVAINKPPGILVHRTKISEDNTFVLQLLRKQLQQRLYPIHRLDRATSGVLVFGKSKAAAGILGEQIREKKVEKNYLAIVRGYVEAQATIDYPLAPEPHRAKQEAITHYQKIAQVEFPAAIGRYPTARYSFVHIQTETGRRHQIRKHFSHLRHPIIGDKRHGDLHHNKYFKESLHIPRLLLHAAHFSFSNQQHTISITAPLEENFQKAITALGFPFPEANEMSD